MYRLPVVFKCETFKHREQKTKNNYHHCLKKKKKFFSLHTRDLGYVFYYTVYFLKKYLNTLYNNNIYFVVCNKVTTVLFVTRKSQ